MAPGCREYESCAVYGFEDGFDNLIWGLEWICPRCVAVLRLDPVLNFLPLGVGRFARGVLQRFSGGTFPRGRAYSFCFWWTLPSIAYALAVAVPFYGLYVVFVVAALLNALLSLWIVAAILGRLRGFYLWARGRIMRSRVSQLEQETAEMRLLVRSLISRTRNSGGLRGMLPPSFRDAFSPPPGYVALDMEEREQDATPAAGSEFKSKDN